MAFSQIIVHQRFSARPTVFPGCDDLLNNDGVFKDDLCDVSKNQGDFFGCFLSAASKGKLTSDYGKEELADLSPAGITEWRKKMAKKSVFAELSSDSYDLPFMVDPYTFSDLGSFSLFLRKQYDFKDQPADLQGSLVDFIFNRDKLQSGIEFKQPPSDETTTDKFKKIARTGFFAGVATFEPKTFEKENAEITRTKANVDALEVRLNNMFMLYNAARGQAALFLHDGGVAIVARSNMKVTLKTQDNVTQTSIVLDDGLENGRAVKKAEGEESQTTKTITLNACWDTLAQKKVACADQSDVNQPAGIEFSFTPETGKLHYAIQLTDPAAFGLIELPIKRETGSAFQILAPEKLKGLTLEFDLYPRLLGGITQLLSGNLTIKRGNEKAYEGTIALYKEQIRSYVKRP